MKNTRNLKKLNKLILFGLIGIALSISSCSNKLEVNESDTNNSDISNNNQDISIKDLDLSEDFNWKTFKDINLTITGNANNIVKVVSSKGLLYQQAFLSTGTAYTMKLTVPSHENAVRILFNEQDIPIDISSGNAEYSFQ